MLSTLLLFFSLACEVQMAAHVNELRKAADVCTSFMVKSIKRALDKLK